MTNSQGNVIVSQSDISKFRSKVENDIQPPANGGDEEQRARTPLREGLYMLRNKKARTVLTLCRALRAFNRIFVFVITLISLFQGGHEETTECHGVWPNTNAAIGHQLWLIQNSSLEDTYMVRNIHYAKYMEVKSGLVLDLLDVSNQEK